MKTKVCRIGILIVFIIVNTLLCGCGNESVSLEGEWHFVSMLFDGTEVTPEQLKSIDHDEPSLECTESEFTLTVKVDSNKQTLTLRDSYEVQKAMGSTLTIVFER